MDILERKTEFKDIEFIAFRTNEGRSVISRGFNVDDVILEAKNSGYKYILTCKPSKDQTFIF